MEKSKQNQNAGPNSNPNMNGHRDSFDHQADANMDPLERARQAHQGQTVGRYAVRIAQQRRRELFGWASKIQDPDVPADPASEELPTTTEQLSSTTEEAESRQREAERQQEAERQRREAEQERLRQEAEEQRQREAAAAAAAAEAARRQQEEAARRRQEQERTERERKQREEAERQKRERESTQRQKPGEKLSEAEEIQKAQDKMRELREEAERRRKEAAEKNISLHDQAEYARAHIGKYLTNRDLTEFSSFDKDDMREVIQTILSKRELGESDRLIYVDFLRKAQFNDPAEVLRAQISGYLTYKYPVGGRTVDTARTKDQTQYRF